MLRLAFIAFMASVLPHSGAGDRPQECDVALGTCCCTLPSGLQCCGTAGNCDSGIIPGCDCKRGGSTLF